MQTLELTFSHAASVEKFAKFLDHIIGCAGAYLRHENVVYSPFLLDEGGTFKIKGTPHNLYMVGYDWALWQFPPQNTRPVS